MHFIEQLASVRHVPQDHERREKMGHEAIFHGEPGREEKGMDLLELVLSRAAL